MTRKIVSEMTYNVSMGTLNPTIPMLHRLYSVDAPAHSVVYVKCYEW